MAFEDKSDDRMHRDNWLSVLIGPLKFIVPTLSYLVLYPLMISKTSIEVVGLWSLFATIISFIGVTDIGFSQLLIRDAGPDRALHYSEVYADYVTAQRCYILILLVLITIFIVTSGYIFAPIATVYSTVALTASAVLIFVGAIIQLTSKLDAAILSARHDNYIVQLVTAIAPVLTYSAAITGTFFKRPIEGLAFGTLLTGVATLAVYRFRLSHKHNEWNALARPIGLHDTVKRLFPLTRRGWHLYSSSVGMMIRGPIYRLIIISTIGLQAAAVFDIAMRITLTIRSVIAEGFSVLYPSFSVLYRSGERAKIIELIQISLMVLLPLGALFLGLLVVAITPILSLWLGTYPPELILSTRVLAIWQLITLANVPFWHLLQASHNERMAAYSIWAHTVSILFIIPASSVYSIGIVDLMVYWTVTSVLTQGLIYYYVQKRLKLLWEPILTPRILTLLVLVAVYFTLSYWMSFSIMKMWWLVVNIGFTTAIFIAISTMTVVKPIFQFFRTEKC
jgi:O-antigen/teichoic acid export membrane protein